MRSHTLLFLPAYVAAHGAMITPAPRSAHNQVLDNSACAIWHAQFGMRNSGAIL